MRSSTRLNASIRSFVPAAMLLTVGACALTGCSNGSGKLEKNASELRSNPSPEATTLYQRQNDVDNAMTVTFDENLRMAKEDWGRFWLTNRPSRLTPEPVPR